MGNRYKPAYLEEDVTFRFDNWLQTRRDNMQCTNILWLRNKKMMVEPEGIYNGRVAIMIFNN